MIGRFVKAFKSVPAAAERMNDPDEIKKKYRYWRLRMFYSLWFGYVIYYVTRKNLSAVAHVFTRALGISDQAYGAMNSIHYSCYGIGKLLNGVIGDRANIRVFMALGLVASSIINLLFPSMQTVWLLVALWGLNGVVQSAGFPPVAKGLVAWFGPSERATIWSLWSSAHQAGTALAGLLVGLILQYLSWPWAFYVPGVIGLITSGFLLNRLRDRPVAMGLPPIGEYRNDPSPVKAESHLRHRQVLWKYVFTNPYIWVLSLANMCVYIVRFGTLDWGTKFLFDARGVSGVKSTVMWSLMPFFGMFGGILAGTVSDKVFRGRCSPMVILYFLLLVGAIYGLYQFGGVEHFYLSCFFLAAIGFLIDGPHVMVGGVQVTRLTTQEAASAACGFAGFFGYIGAIISGAGLGYVKEHYGWGAMYAVCGGCCVLGAILVGLTWNKEKQSASNHLRAKV